MIFKPYYYFESGCAAYLFGCGGLGKCAVVDAHEEDITAYAAFAESKGMRITHVIDTHVHADHRRRLGWRGPPPGGSSPAKRADKRGYRVGREHSLPKAGDCMRRTSRMRSGT